MKFGVIATGLFLVLLTVGAVMLLTRTGSFASKTMVTGAAIFWTGIALAIFGPKTRVTHGPYPKESKSEIFIQSYSMTDTPSLPVAYIIGTGLVLLAAGFLIHAIRA